MSLLPRAVLTLAHGLWIWHTPQVLGAPHGAEHLRDFCQQQGITEVYVSFSPDVDFAPLVVMLHGARIRVEALLSSTDADEAGPHREKLLGKVRAVIQYNARHQDARFDGIHLDIEPQQRPENKGPGNLAYLPGLVEAYRAVRHESDAASLGIDADIQTKLLKGSADQRQTLLAALPRYTLMLYELPRPDAATLRETSQRMLAMAYDGVSGSNLATMAVGLRTQDYGDSLPQMLHTLDDTDQANPHYAGWAWHAYQ